MIVSVRWFLHYASAYQGTNLGTIPISSCIMQVAYATMNTIKKRSDCPLSFSLDLLRDKWSLLIIRDLLMTGKFSFSEFSGSKEKIASNILADRLSLLESSGVITKHVSPKNRSKFIY